MHYYYYYYYYYYCVTFMTMPSFIRQIVISYRTPTSAAVQY
jgi:hypothetical protein